MLRWKSSWLKASGSARSAECWASPNRLITAGAVEYRGLKLEQARRMNDLEKDNGRLKKAVAELTLDKQLLKEALEGNFQALNAGARARCICSSGWVSRNGTRAVRVLR